MHDTRANVLAVDVLSERYRRLRLATGWSEWTPGQFVMVCPPKGATFIRRPFGIVDIAGGVLEICFKIVGPGTHALADAKEGDELMVLGPLGRGFESVGDAVHVLVAGGYGIAPLIGLARRCMSAGQRVVFVYGAKTGRDLLYVGELEQLGCDLQLVTEDGSRGAKGVVLAPLERVLDEHEHAAVYAVGPHPMMKAAADLAAQHGVPAYVSMDEYMACGIGVCLGCMCATKDGAHVRACREGPVFDARALRW